MVLLMRSLAVHRQHTKPSVKGSFQALPTVNPTVHATKSRLNVGRDRDMPEIGVDT